MNDFFVVPVSDESKAAARKDAANALALEVAAFIGHIESEFDITECGGPNWAMALMQQHGGGLERALRRFREVES